MNHSISSLPRSGDFSLCGNPSRICSFISFSLVLLLAFWLTPAFSATLSSTPSDKGWVTNGEVKAIATDGTSTYIGGTFSYVGPYTGTAVPLSASTGYAPSRFPKINGVVYAVVADGLGGWYLGGNFTKVDEVARNRIAHILADGSLDRFWNPNANNAVRVIAVSGAIIYAGGDFTNIGGQTRNRIAALDVTTGLSTAWNPNANNIVYSLIVGGTKIYAGGSFTTIGGQTRNRIAVLDKSTGIATTWNPNANNTVNALAVNGTTVYAGGSFTNIGGQTRNYIAALDESTGNATSWNPGADTVTSFTPWQRVTL